MARDINPVTGQTGKEHVPEPSPIDGLADRLDANHAATQRFWDGVVQESQPFPDGGPLAHVDEATDERGRPYTAAEREAIDNFRATEMPDPSAGSPDLSSLSLDDLKALVGSQAHVIGSDYADNSRAPQPPQPEVSADE